MAILNKTVSQYLTDIGGGPYNAGDTVTIVDTGANIASLTNTQIAALATNNVDAINASDDLITLAGDQAIALAGSVVTVSSSDFLILSDTGSNLAGISSTDYAAIAAKGFGIVTSSGGSVSYTVAQYQAITNGGMAIDGANTVTLADTGANTAALTAAQISALAGNGVDTIDTSNNTLSLTVAKFAALGAVTLTAGDAVTIADTGANISTLTAVQIGTATVDTIDATSGVISWTKVKYDAGVTKISGESVTLADTGTNLAAINAAGIGGLDAQVDAYDATDNTLSLDLSQLDALTSATIALTAGDTVTATDSQANLEALTGTNFTNYIAQGVDRFDSTDNVLNLTVAQTNAVASGGGSFVTGDVVTVADSAANIGNLTSTQIANMSTALVDAIDSATDAITWTAAKITALGNVDIATNDAVTISDTGANIAGITASQFTAIDGKSAASVVLNASDNAISFTVAQVNALGATTVHSSDAITIADTGANIGALTAGQITSLVTLGGGAASLTINASDNAFTWTAAKAANIGSVVAIHSSDTLTIADTGSNIAGLSAADIGDLAGVAGTVLINASDNAFTWDTTKAAALGDITVDATDTLTVADTDIGALSSSDITDLAGIAASVIFNDTSGDAYTLDVAKAAVVGDVSLHSSDTVTVSDADIGALSSTQIANLAAKDATVIFDDTGGNAYTLTAAKAAAVGDISLITGDTVTVSDTGANLASSLTSTIIANLEGKAAAVVLDASNNVLNLTVAQVAAVTGNLTLTAGDIISILDTGANIAAMSAGTISGLAAKNIDIINASDDTLSLTIAQFQALGSVNLNNADTVTISDTGANVATLTSSQIAALASSGVDAVNATDNAITFTADQASAVGSVSFHSSDTITVSDTGANIAGLTSTQIATLDGLAATVLINASDNAITFTAAQASAIGTITVHSSDAITVADTGSNIGGMSQTDISDLAALAATVTINASDNAFTWTAAKASGLGDVAVHSSDTLTVADTGANIAALTATQISVLDALAGTVLINSSTNAITFTAAQAAALGTITFDASDVITVADSGANLAGLTTGDLTDLATIDTAGSAITLDASDNTLSLASAQAAVLAGVDVAASDAVTLADTGANIGALSTGTIGILDGLTATVTINASDNAFTWTVAKAQAIGGVLVHSSDTMTVSDTGANIGGFSSGEITALAALSGSVVLNASDDAFTWNAAKAAALGDVGIHSSDTLTVSDSGANIGSMATSDFTDLAAAAGTVLINASDNAVTLNAAKAAAIGDITWHSSDTVTVSDTGAAIAGLTAGQITALDGLAAAVVLNASDNAITFTAAQAAALGTITIHSSDAVSLVDTGANLSALTLTDIGELATIAAGAASMNINASDNVLSLTVAKYNALGTITLTSGDVVTFADTGANLAALNAAAINALNNVDTWDASDNAISLTKAQLDALADGTPITLTAGDVVSFADSQANIEALSAGNISGYISQGVDVFDATGNTLNVTAAQAVAVVTGLASFATGDVVTIVDTGANIANLTALQIAALGTANVDFINASDNAFTWTIAQAAALGNVDINSSDTLTISDTGANIANLTAGDLADLSTSGASSVTINASDNLFTWTAAIAAGLGDVNIHSTDVVTISDTGSNIATLSAADLADLSTSGASSVTINASDNAFTFTKAQAAAIGAVAVHSSDTVTVADTGSNIGGFTSGEITTLANLAGTVLINASDNAFTWTVAKAAAIGDITVHSSDTLTVADTGSNIASLTGGQITALDNLSGTVLFNASDNAVTLTAAQAAAVGTTTWDATDTVTVADTGANIGGLTATDLSDLAALGATVLLNASDNAITFTAAKAAAIGDITVHSSDVVTVADTGANIAGLTSGQLTALSTLAGSVVLDASDNAISLTAAKAVALGDVGIAASDTLTIADTGANIAALTTGQLTAIDGLAAAVVLDASDNALSLSKAQYLALGATTLTAGDTVKIADTGANIASFTTTQISGLAAANIDSLDASDNALTLTKAQYDVLGAVGLTGADVVTMTATSTQIAALTTTQIAAINTKGVDIIDLSNNAITLTAAQFNALGNIAFATNDVVTITGLATTLADTIDGSAGNDNIDGLAGNDSITGDAGADSLDGNAGNDTIIGGSGVNTLSGGDGNDSLVAGDSGDSLDGDAGNDTIAGGALADTVSGGLGTDSITGGAGNDSILGDGGNDTIAGGANNDTINGGTEADSISGDAGTDSLLGDAGNDTINGGTGNDTIAGGDGVDSILGGDDNDTITGGDGGDKLFGENGNDTIDGGDDADSIDGGIGTDSLIGGLGNDTVDGDAGNDTIAGGDGIDSILGGDDNDTITGDAGNDRLFGEAGNDTIDGGADNDSIDGGIGTDSLTGGLGNDTILGAAGNDTIIAGDGTDSVRGGDDNDTITGGIDDDRLFGDAGNDTIDGGADDDSIDGGIGADSLLGSAGNDTIGGDVGNDTIIAGDGTDSVRGGDDNDSITGDAGNDRLFGEDGNDTIDGGADNDSINGGAGADSLTGGTGAGLDTIVGDAGNDTIVAGDGADSVNGGADNDSITGDAGNDTIFAGDGDDTVDGGADNDSITGGAGRA